MFAKLRLIHCRSWRADEFQKLLEDFELVLHTATGPEDFLEIPYVFFQAGYARRATGIFCICFSCSFLMSLSYAYPALRFCVLFPLPAGSTVPSAALLDLLIARLQLVPDRHFQTFAALYSSAFLHMVVPVCFVKACLQFRMAQRTGSLVVLILRCVVSLEVSIQVPFAWSADLGAERTMEPFRTLLPLVLCRREEIRRIFSKKIL